MVIETLVAVPREKRMSGRRNLRVPDSAHSPYVAGSGLYLNTPAYVLMSSKVDEIDLLDGLNGLS